MASQSPTSMDAIPINIRRASEADIPSILTLERRCATAGHWSEPQYWQLLGARDSCQGVVFVAERSGVESSQNQVLLGFLVARHLGPECELENIVVDPTVQRRGVGRQLLDALLVRARNAGSEAVFLEVRESNTAARRFYEQAGFQPTARRRGYYSAPSEDAIPYRRNLP